MADHVHFLGEPFQFERVDLTTPNGLQGGAYFTKLTHNNEPLYVQTPKCGTRQGIVISGKKAHYDILLDSESNSPAASERTAFIEWLEGVEERVVQLLHEKGRVWFTNELTVEDIRSLFTSPIKSSRGGTQFLVRANILPSKTNSGHFACSVYDERENQTSIEYVTPDHAIISIIEVTGVRFTSRSFQLELASKQLAVLANKPMFETCIIKKDVSIRAQPAPAPQTAPAPQPAPAPAQPAPQTAPQTAPLSVGLAEVEVDTIDATKLQSVHIKSPVEVYYAMYRAAILRAREAKKIAIESYLDAKNIKNVYKLNLVDDDDNDDNDDDDDDDDDEDDEDDGDDDGSEDDGDCNDTLECIDVFDDVPEDDHCDHADSDRKHKKNEFVISNGKSKKKLAIHDTAILEDIADATLF